MIKKTYSENCNSALNMIDLLPSEGIARKNGLICVVVCVRTEENRGGPALAGLYGISKKKKIQRKIK